MNVQCVLVVALGEQKYLYGRWKSGAVVGCQVLMVGTALCRGTCSKQGRSYTCSPGSADPDEFLKTQWELLFITVLKRQRPRCAIAKTPSPFSAGFAPGSKAALYPISQHRNSATVVYEVKKRNMQVIRCMYTPDLAVATRMDGQDKISAAARCTVHFSPLEGMHCFLTADIYLCFLECQRKRWMPFALLVSTVTSIVSFAVVKWREIFQFHCQPQ